MSTGNRIISGNARSFVRYAIIKSSKNEKNAKKLTVLLIKICKVLPTIGMVLFGKHQVPRQRNTAVIKTCLTRSEERRVGKECSYRRVWKHEEEKQRRSA